MIRRSGTDHPINRRRILFASLVLSAVLHTTLLTVPGPGNSSDASRNDTTVSIGIELQQRPPASEMPAADTATALAQSGSVAPSPALALPDPLPVPDTRPAQPQPAVRTEAPAPAFTPLQEPEPEATATPLVDSRRVIEPEPSPPVITTATQEVLAAHVTSLLPELASTPAPREHSWTHDNQIFQARLHDPTTPGPTRTQQRNLRVQTIEESGRVLTADITLHRTAFSGYAKFVDRWDRDVWLSGDEVIGRFHSNSRIRVETSRRLRPVFNGPVTVAEPMRMSRDLRDPDIFPQGIRTGTDPIPMPATSLDQDAIARADGQSGQSTRFFPSDTDIEFLAGGGYRWENDDGHSGRVQPSPVMYLIASDGVTLSVQGTVNGQVLVYAPRRLVVTGNLTYHEPPEQNPASTHLLGLVSDGSVLVAPPSVTGRGNLEIHASIYAGRRFAVQQFRVRQNDVMTIHGSLTAGSVSATEPRYRTRIIHDDRLSVLRPPHFPQTSVWTHGLIPERWSVADAGVTGAPDTIRIAGPDTPADAADTAGPAPGH